MKSEKVSKGEVVRKAIGKRRFKLKNILELRDDNAFIIDVLDINAVEIGRIQFFDPLIRPIFTFLDYKINLNVNVVPVIVIDFSLSNLTFQEDKECIHTLKESEENLYLTVLENIMQSFKNLSVNVMAFGMGALTKPNQKSASDIFALSGDVFSPIIETNELISKYKEVLGKIRISSPVKFAPIMNLISEYAKYEAENYECRNYFNLIYITPGVLDDYRETLEWLNDIQNIPMSVTVIKIKNEQLTDSNDIITMITELDSVFQKCDRHYLDFIEFEHYELKKNKFQHEVAKRIPFHIQSYMENNNIFAYNLLGEDYATQKAIEMKVKDAMKDKDVDLQIEIANRESMIGIKEYVKSFELLRTSQVKEETKGSFSHIAIQINDEQSWSSRDSFSSTESSKIQWFKKHRKLSYSKIHKRQYLNTLEKANKLSKQDLRNMKFFWYCSRNKK